MEEYKFVCQMEGIIAKFKHDRIKVKLLPEYITLYMTSRDIPPRLKCVEVKDSPIHGVGVFAKEDIEAGRVVSLFPCHGILRGEEIHTKFAEEFAYFNPLEYMSTPNLEGESFIGIPSNQNAGVGHLFNDSFKQTSEFDKVESFEDMGNLIIKYMLSSLQNDNTVLIHMSNYIYVRTIRPIKAGEELFCSYGYNFWMPKIPPKSLEMIFQDYLKNLPENKRNLSTKIYQDYLNRSKPIEFIEKLDIMSMSQLEEWMYKRICN